MYVCIFNYIYVLYVIIVNNPGAAATLLVVVLKLDATWCETCCTTVCDHKFSKRFL